MRVSKSQWYIYILGFSLLYACSFGDETSTSVEPKNIIDTTVNKYSHINTRIKASPNSPDLYLERAEMYLSNLEYDLAFGDVDRAIILDSTNANAYYQKGLVNFSKGQIQLSKEAVEKAILLDENYVLPKLKLAEIQLISKRYPESIQTLNNVLKIDVYNADAYFYKGMNFLMMNDSIKAISSFQTAIDQNNEYYDAYVQLGLIYTKRKNPLAVEYFDGALVSRPNSIEAHYNRSYFLQANNKVSDAIVGYKKILLIDSLNRNALFNIGYCQLVYLLNYDSAIIGFSELLRYFPRDYNALCNRAVSYENLGDFKNAEIDFRKCLEIKPNFTLAAQGLSRIIN